MSRWLCEVRGGHQGELSEMAVDGTCHVTPGPGCQELSSYSAPPKHGASPLCQSL